MSIQWQELSAHLCAKFAATTLHATRLGLVWRFPNGLADQHQYVEVVTAFAAPHVAITCDVGAATSLVNHEALRLNAELPVGALAVVGSRMMLRALVALEDVPLDGVERILQRVAHTASSLRTKVKRPQAVASTYYE